jgi:hypothetical protein
MPKPILDDFLSERCGKKREGVADVVVAVVVEDMMTGWWVGAVTTR